MTDPAPAPAPAPPPKNRRKLILRILLFSGLALGSAMMARLYVRGAVVNPERRDAEGLRAGDVESRLIERDGRLWLQFSALMDAPIDRVWKVVRDYEAMSQFMPSTAKIQIVAPRRARVDIGFLGFSRWSEITLTDESTSRERVEAWSQTSGSMASNRGRWVLVDVKGGRTFVRYEIDADSGLPVPGWFERGFLRDVLRVVLWRVEKRAKE